jgi:hypothetical protein
MRIKVAEDFSPRPAGRYLTDGPFSGGAFRKRLLKPSVARHEAVTVDLDGVRGYASSFLEEAFGGLVKEEGFSGPELHQRLRIESKHPSYVYEIWRYIDEAVREPG